METRAPVPVERLLEQRAWVHALAHALVRDAAAADDVAQDAWLVALRRPPRHGAALRAWFARIVRHRVSNARRAAERRTSHELAAPVPRPASIDPANAVAHVEELGRVVHEVLALPEPYRETVVLRFYADLDAHAIAERMGVPVETVRTRIKRALARLRERLDAEHGGDGRAWVLALVPLAGTRQGEIATLIHGGALMASTKTAAVAGAALGALLTAGAMTIARPAPEEPRVPETSRAAAAPGQERTARQERTDAKPPAVAATDASGAAAAPLARAIDAVSFDAPPRGTGTIGGHVTTRDGKPVEGVVVRASSGRVSSWPTARRGRLQPPPSVEDAVRRAAVDAKWREATTRETKTDASGAYVLTEVIDAKHWVEASADGWEVQRTGIAMSVAPGATVDFVAVPIVDVPVMVLMPDATPAKGDVYVTWSRRSAIEAPAQGASPGAPVVRDSGGTRWAVDEPVVPLEPGTWMLTAMCGQTLRSEPVVATAVKGAGGEQVVLRLASTETDPSPAAKATTQVRASLEWLKRRQGADGRWSGGARGDVAPTALALLSFIGDGHTQNGGAYSGTVARGLAFLGSVQDAEGCFGRRDSAESVRDHALGVLALVEACGMSGSRILRDAAQRGVDYALKTRTPTSGWHRPASDGGELDLEATAWMTFAVKSAEMQEGLRVDKSAIPDALAALDKLTDRATGRIVVPRGSRTALLSDDAATAVGMLIRSFSGHTLSNDEMYAKAADALAAKPPFPDSDLAYLYFGTLAMNQVGGERWTKWLAALPAATADRSDAREGSPDHGSWLPPGGSATEADRLFATALGCLSTEIWSRFARVAAAK